MFKENLKNKQSYEQLKKDMIELKYFTSVAKKYNVSDNCIRKLIKNMKNIQIKYHKNKYKLQEQIDILKKQ